MALLSLYALCVLLTATLSLSAAVFEKDVVDTSLTTRATSPLDFTGANWIWNSTYIANAWIAVRKDFVPPLGKSLIAAEIVMTSGEVDFYVNGELIGANAYPNPWQYAGRYCVDLLPSFNVFAANSTSPSVAHGAVIASIRVTYNDFTTDIIVTDSSWRVHPWVVGFEQLSFDDAAWPTATVKALYPAVYGALDVASNPPVMSFDFNPSWVWTDISTSGTTNVPASSRAFRRTFTPAVGQIPMSATIIIAADDAFTIWVNGVQVGSDVAGTWQTARQYKVNFISAPSEIVFAVLGTNSATGRAGILVAAEINMVPTGRANCTAGAWVLSDASWVSTTGAIPTGWQQPGFDDSAWPVVVAEAVYPAIWGTVTIAAASPPVNV
ncbi:hypothetical protein FB451DRAFT_1568633 [Mycena latifolia]|nr:hypothetical protein FB451DRAFT_1568633 [Mycena latifolia]